MPNVIVTPRSLSQGGANPLLDRIRQAGYDVVFPSPGAQPTEAQLIAVLPDAIGYLAGVEKISANALSHAHWLRVISRNGTGIDNIDLEAAKAKNITVRKADGANARGVAELTFGHLLAAARQIPASDSVLKGHRWERFKGFELQGKVLGLLGCGKIGKLVTGFALAFDMDVVAHDLFPDPTFRPSPRFRYASFDEVVSTSDVLSLHCPPTASGRPVLSQAELQRMKAGAVVINTARQSLVDEVAMGEALRTKTVATYTLDAFDHEPPTDWNLVGHQSVIATPHIGAFTEESIQRATEVAVENLLEALSREPVGKL